MVGRAGRSKGCLTCRKRHLKCDEVKPTCQRCRCDGLYCDGYAAISFVNENDRFIKPKFPHQGFVARQTLLSSAFSYGSQPFRDEKCLLYLRYLFSPSESETKIGEWPGFQAANDHSTLSYQCLDSLAKAYFGRMQAVHGLFQEGLILYVRSLQVLHMRLADPVKMSEDDTMLSILILIVYEMLILSTNKGWINHALGLGTIIQIRGPRAFQGNFRRGVLEHVRFLIILASMALSKRTFLALPEWKTIPWIASESLNPMHGLIDIMTKIPGLKEMQEESANPVELYSSAKEVLSELLTWRNWWDSISHSETSALHLSEEDPLWSEISGTALQYRSIHAANCACVSNAAIIQTTEIIAATNIPSSSFDLDTLSRNAAVEICRSVSYQLSQSNFAKGHFMILFPMRMAWKAFGGGATSQGRWIEQVLQKIEMHNQSWGITRQTITYPAISQRLTIEREGSETTARA